HRHAERAVARPGLLLDDGGLVREGAAATAVLGGHRGAQQAELARPVVQRAAGMPLRDELLLVRDDLPVDEVAGEFAYRLDLVVPPRGACHAHDPLLDLLDVFDIARPRSPGPRHQIPSTMGELPTAVAHAPGSEQSPFATMVARVP